MKQKKQEFKKKSNTKSNSIKIKSLFSITYIKKKLIEIH